MGVTLTREARETTLITHLVSDICAATSFDHLSIQCDRLIYLSIKLFSVNYFFILRKKNVTNGVLGFWGFGVLSFVTI